MKSDFKKRKLQTHGYRCKDSLKILNPVIIQIDKMLQPRIIGLLQEFNVDLTF